MDEEHTLTHQDSKSFLSNLEIITKLGEGTYGSVSRVWDK